MCLGLGGGLLTTDTSTLDQGARKRSRPRVRVLGPDIFFLEACFVFIYRLGAVLVFL